VRSRGRRLWSHNPITQLKTLGFGPFEYSKGTALKVKILIAGRFAPFTCAMACPSGFAAEPYERRRATSILENLVYYLW
jgi:hypothetical protein